MQGSKKDINNKEHITYKDHVLSSLQEYGEIENERKFDIDIQGKVRKYPIITLDKTKIDLVDALREQTGYSFFFFEGKDFSCRTPSVPRRKKEINYKKNEINDPGFFLSLFHEVGHFPINYNKNRLQYERESWIKGIELAKIFKTEYNACFLAGFRNHRDIYKYIKKFVKTYE